MSPEEYNNWICTLPLVNKEHVTKAKDPPLLAWDYGFDLSPKFWIPIFGYCPKSPEPEHSSGSRPEFRDP